jgi:RimJ/RimL family protein N-acetyltransferase
MESGVINSGKILLRPKSMGDAHDDYSWRCDEELSQLDASRTISQTYEEYLRGYKYELNYKNPYSIRFAIDTKGGQHIGNMMCYDINMIMGECEIGIMIGNRDYWNNGYGFDSMVGLIDHMFTYRGMYKIYLHTLVWNTRAQKAFKRCGFNSIETVHKYGYDFLYMELEKNTWINIRPSIMKTIEEHSDQVVDFNKE